MAILKTDVKTAQDTGIAGHIVCDKRVVSTQATYKLTGSEAIGDILKVATLPSSAELIPADCSISALSACDMTVYLGVTGDNDAFASSFALSSVGSASFNKKFVDSGTKGVEVFVPVSKTESYDVLMELSAVGASPAGVPIKFDIVYRV